MAQKVLVELVDDLDGTKADSTVLFGLDGVTYEIDLTEAHADRLRDDLAEFIDNARRTGGRVRRGVAGHKQKPSDVSPADVREWARANDIELADRGRIPAHVAERYRVAQEQETSGRPTRSAARGKRTAR